MVIEASGTFKAGPNIQYFRTLVHGKALRLFHVFYAEVEDATPVTLGYIILCLVRTFTLLMTYQSKFAQSAAE